MLNVLIDTSPLQNANAIRGVGIYTKMLVRELQKNKNLHVETDIKKITQGLRLNVVHYPYFDLFFSTLPVFRALPTVVTIHDVIPLVFPTFHKPGQKGRVRFFKQRFAVQSAQAVITDSEASKKDIIKYLHVSPARVHVVYLAGNPDIQKTSPKVTEEVLKKYGISGKYILYVGDINYNKNIPQLIKSLKFLPDDVQLVCVGKNFRPQPIPEWNWIETQVALSDVASRVHFLTEVTGDATVELSALYSGAQCYVQPSLYEGFGLPVLEAMNCKVPVVSAQNSSLIEVGGEHVQYVGTDAEAIAGGVRAVFELSASAREKRVKDAYEWSQTFSWQKTAPETVKVYEQVAK